MARHIRDEVVLLTGLTGEGLLPEDAGLLKVGIDDLGLEVDHGAEPVLLVGLGVLGRRAVLGER